MATSPPAWRQTALYTLFITFCVLSLLGSWGGPDVLGDAQPLIWGAILLAWFGSELRKESGTWLRRVLWLGIVAAVGVIVGALGEIFLG